MQLFKIKLVFFTFLISFLGFSQNQFTVQLNWNEEPGEMVFPTKNIPFPSLENSFVNETEFLFLLELKRPSLTSKVQFEVIEFQSERADQVSVDFLKLFNFTVNDNLEFSFKNIAKGGQPISVFSLFPYIMSNGELQRITSITLSQRMVTQDVLKSSNFASSSVLKEGSGTWYKIGVDKDGIYKIDYDQLKEMGIDVDNVNPTHINIYGNAFGKLPELNSVYRPDDLLKNDIVIVGGDDGSFDKNDYILFYGKGPHKWEFNAINNRFQRILNPYSSFTAYFINVNSSESPARVQSASLSSQVATQVVTDFDSYTIHEEELKNIKRSGQRWYGELFDAHLTQSFPLYIPNLNPAGGVSLRGAMASAGGANVVTSFKVKYGNSTLTTVGMTTPGENTSFSRGEFLLGTGTFQPTSSNFAIGLEYTRSSPSASGYLDFLEVNARSYLKYYNGIQFRDLNSVGLGEVAEMNISSFPSNGIVWEVTNPTTPKNVTGTVSSGTLKFKVNSDSLREFIAFDGSSLNRVTLQGRVTHQNLHGLPQVDYLMVTHPLFLAQANRLANLHRENGLTVHVVTTTQVYNEFSGGMQDPTGIKFFTKMFYDRAGGNVANMPKFLLLFGDGTYDPLDRVENNNNRVVMYETMDSETYTGSLVSDDYFGFLDDEEGFATQDFLDIAVGRLIATTEEDAVNFVNKIEHYMKNGSNFYSNTTDNCCDEAESNTHGDWRNRYVLIGDDEEHGHFLNVDLEPASDYVLQNHPEMNAKKIYIDAYPQITTAGGERYPQVNSDITRSVENGALVTCFVGHGGPTGATSERVITMKEVQDYTNIDRLTLFVSATCEFARVDDNERVSVGEWMALNENGGAIALMTTSRAVYFSTNSHTTKMFFQNVFDREADHKPRTFGDIITKTKNDVTLLPNYGGTNNKRSFMLLGDPALRIALPYYKVVLDSVNGADVNVSSATIQALSGVRMSGHIEDHSGNVLTDFNGFVQPSIYDKPSDRKTLGQDATSPVIDFQTQENMLFKGKSTVKDGYFDFEFIVPKDINYEYGNGKVSFYAWTTDLLRNAGGYSDSVIIGGIDTLGLNDQNGPDIELYLNDESFVNGGITNDTPILIAKLYDESGINTVGNGIGHDITLIIDDKSNEAKVLNEFYESDLDTYKSGQIRYQLDKLEPGRHTLTFKAWDVNNNSSEKKLDFIVQEQSELQLDHVLNYPNPFTTYTEFFFEHNQVCSALETQIEIFTVTGRIVKTINTLVTTNGFRSAGIPWDGRDEFGDELGKGVYVYRITVKTEEGDRVQKVEKLYLL